MWKSAREEEWKVARESCGGRRGKRRVGLGRDGEVGERRDVEDGEGKVWRAARKDVEGAREESVRGREGRRGEGREAEGREGEEWMVARPGCGGRRGKKF